MAAWVLLLSSLIAVLLLVFHSWRRRGVRATAAFFLSGILFGILRGNIIYYIIKLISGTGEGGKPYLPQSALVPGIGHASIQVVIGWIFAGYLAWTLSEYVLRRLKGWEGKLFPTVALAGLFLGAMSYCMEAVAMRVGWWYWDISTVNPLFGTVPITGVIAWVSVATDLLFPVLFIACSEYRRRPWRWLALLVFPLHMGVHALYNTVLYIDNYHVVMVLVLAGCAVFGRTRIETGMMRRVEGRKAGAGSMFVDLIPAIAVVIFLAVILRAGLLAAGDVTLAFTAIPLVVFALLSAPRIPMVVVTLCAAAGLAVWPFSGGRALYSFAPLLVFAAFYSIGRARERRVVASGWLAAVVVASGVFVVSEETQRSDIRRYIGLLKQARTAEARGYRDVARDYLDKALKIKFTDPGYLLSSIEFLLMLNEDRLEAVLPEAKKRFRSIMEMDPYWAAPRTEWVVFLMLDGQLDEAIKTSREIVTMQPGMASHHAILGYLLLRHGDLDEAEKELKRAVTLGTERDGVRANLDAIASAKANSDTVDLLDITAPETFSRLAGVLQRRSVKRANAGDVASGLKLIREAVHYQPHSARCRLTYAAMLAPEGGAVPQEAVRQCEMAARLEPDLLPARQTVVRLCVRLAREQNGRGGKDAARATLHRALPYADGQGIAEIGQMLQELDDAAEQPE